MNEMDMFFNNGKTALVTGAENCNLLIANTRPNFTEPLLLQ